MGRKKIKQEVLFRSIRITSNDGDLIDFVQHPDINLNKLIKKLLLNCPDYKVWQQHMDDQTNFLISTAFFDC